MTNISYATTWSITYDHHSDDSRGVIYDRNIFTIHTRKVTFSLVKNRSCAEYVCKKFLSQFLNGHSDDHPL
jgi:hypothetical protein